MIKVLLSGGLGNQMFQYAFGKNLAVKNNTQLVLDTRYLESKLPFKRWASQMKYELDIFDLDVSVEHVFLKSEWLYPFAKMEYILSDVLNSRKLTILKENGFQFNADYLNAKDNTYVKGNFQSEKYFESIAAIIRNDFKFIKQLDSRNDEIKSAIENSTAVSLHIRRGDYVQLKQNVNKFCQLSLSYYQQAIEMIASKEVNPVFYVFSDDMPWVKENLKIGFPVHFIDYNNTQETTYKDMQLMSLCKHNIIANSTFSWWAAWLNAVPGKMVIAPENWFVDKSIRASDILPAEWIKL